jgi:serine/threonine-protein kinase
MKIFTLWLRNIFIFGIFLSSCNPQHLEPTHSDVSTPTINPTAIHLQVLKNLPEATNTPKPTSSPLVPTVTVTIVPTLVNTEPTSGATRTIEIDQMVQVYVPAGEFIMGSDAAEAKITIEGGRAYPEIPVNNVNLDGYWMDKYEISNGQYALCVEGGVCDPPYLSSSETRYHYYDDPVFSNYPVIWVNWYMAKTYCEWAGRRLPTEAEWEKAARGTDGHEYPWGNEPLSGERANFCDINCRRTIANPNFNDGYADTAPVGSYPAGASPYGAMDMSGNVWEWLGTLIMPYPYDPNDGRENLDINGERSWRGGPWSNGTWWMRSSVRYRSIPSYWQVNLGFRCASSK